jgi:hypothetical protein
MINPEYRPIVDKNQEVTDSESSLFSYNTKVVLVVAFIVVHVVGIPFCIYCCRNKKAIHMRIQNNRNN